MQDQKGLEMLLQLQHQSIVVPALDAAEETLERGRSQKARRRSPQDH
jgi:hypothetical protein